MSRRTTALLAWSLFALCATLDVAYLVLVALDYSAPVAAPLLFESRAADAVGFVPLLAFPTVGALIASRRPENIVGWLFLGAGLFLTGGVFAFELGVHALIAAPGSLAGGETMAWLSLWLYVPGFFLGGVFVLLLFPNGRLLSPRWRPFASLALLGLVIGCVGVALRPGPLDDEPFKFVENPYGVERTNGILDAFYGIGWAVFFASSALAAIALIARFRRAHGEERAQLKWITAAGALAAVSFLLEVPASAISEDAVAITQVLIVIALTAIPVATGLAIFKYRLYEIDLIIRRTLVYGVLTALLAGAYFGIVLALQQVFSSFAGGSDLAIAISTLAVAALFRPVRSRIQALVDRRFYRRRYDAEQTVEAFNARLREEIDLDALCGELQAVVRNAMQPAHLSLWIRADDNGRSPSVTVPRRSLSTKESA